MLFWDVGDGRENLIREGDTQVVSVYMNGLFYHSLDLGMSGIF